MLRVKVVVSGMSVSLKGNASVLKAGKMLEGHAQVCQDMDMITTPFHIGITCQLLVISGSYRMMDISYPAS